MSKDAQNISPADWFAERRADRTDKPILEGLTRDERDAYIRVTDWLIRNPELTELAACKKTLTDFETYLKARKKAVASEREAFSDKCFDFERRAEKRRKTERSERPVAVSKVCRACGEEKPGDAFTWTSSTHQKAICNQCRAAARRKGA